MISNIAIALLAAHTVTGAAIKRDEPTISCTEGQASSTNLATRPSASVPSYSNVVPSSSASISSSVVLNSSSTPTLSSYPIGLLSSSPLPSFTGDISSATSSMLSSSSTNANSSIISSTTPASSTLTPSPVTSSRSGLRTRSPNHSSSVMPSSLAFVSSSLTPTPQSSGYFVRQSSTATVSSDTSLTALPIVGGSSGCVAAFTETIYATASVPTTIMEMLTTIHTTSTVAVTLPALSSVPMLSELAPTPVPQSSGYPSSEQSSSLSSPSPISTIPETSIVPSMTSDSVSVPGSSGAPVYVPSSARASAPASSSAILSLPVVPSPFLPGFSYPASTPGQPTASFYTGPPPSSYGINNSTGAYSNGTAASASTTMISTGLGRIVSTNTISSNSVPIPTGNYSMATSSSPVSPSSSSTVASSPSVLSSPTQGYQTGAPSLTTTTSHSIIMVIPTSTNGVQYKRDIISINLAFSAAQSPSKPLSKSTVGNEVKTIVVPQDPRCPYPYPAIRCGEPSTTVTTVKKATPTSKQSTKKTGSVAWCMYPYPGGKGEACP
ncbi:uncharacterized protein CC84DRAFT_294636 [Paraphaeosphaeria sporulosa]|uniref:Ig-like domain-containing protein n=1 Tax=Paraphaeosphaeria sporulosa TaxID=1460663 RepID=A0A177BXR6_9PLEO|nr:uncharacterized protein CC84DRAFT_294636 [Paraphaeosphaeria sporulosa]OAG00314.1 hypothetical protein CC84DRAFT_294636 [Paraphaeosphaeria sporulosa]